MLALYQSNLSAIILVYFCELDQLNGFVNLIIWFVNESFALFFVNQFRLDQFKYLCTGLIGSLKSSDSVSDLTDLTIYFSHDILW